MIAHRAFHQHRQIAAGRDRQGNRRHAHAQNEPGIAHALQAGFGWRRDVFQLDQMNDQPYPLVALDGAVAEHAADVENPQPAHFQQIAQGGRTGALQDVGRHPGQGRGIVGDQAVAAADQFQSQFAFAHAAAAGDQQTHAKHFQQLAMHHGGGFQTVPVVFEPVENHRQRGRAVPERNTGRIGGNPQRLDQARFVAHQDRARRESQQTVEQFRAGRRSQPVQKTAFVGAENLQPGRLNPVQPAIERGAGLDRRPQDAVGSRHSPDPAQVQHGLQAFKECLGAQGWSHGGDVAAGRQSRSRSNRSWSETVSRNCWQKARSLNISAR